MSIENSHSFQDLTSDLKNMNTPLYFHKIEFSQAKKPNSTKAKNESILMGSSMSLDSFIFSKSNINDEKSIFNDNDKSMNEEKSENVEKSKSNLNEEKECKFTRNNSNFIDYFNKANSSINKDNQLDDFAQILAQSILQTYEINGCFFF